MVEDKDNNVIQKWWHGTRWLHPLIFVALGVLLANMLNSPGSGVFRTVEQGAPSLSGSWSCVVTMNDVGNHFDQSCDTIAPTPSPSPSPTVTQSPTTTTPPVTTTTSPTQSPSPSPTGCPVTGKNKPGAADPWGGCFPGPGNSGVPVGTTLTNYTGPCTITVANTVIDAKKVSCDLIIHAFGVTIRNSEIHGMIDNSGFTNSSFSLTDSLVTNPARDGGCECVGDHNYTVLRAEVVGGLRGGWCVSNCTIQDSWSHGRILAYFDQNGNQCAVGSAKSVPAGCVANHGSGWREEQNGTFTHNSLACDYLFANDTTSLGCSADLTGYADFAGVHNNTVSKNLFISVGPVQHPDDGTTSDAPTSFCAYGGDTQGKPHSNDPGAGTNQVFTNNIFQRGLSKKCGDFGPITDFNPTKPGNIWTNNTFDDGVVIPPA